MGGGAGSTAALRRAGAGTRTIGSIRRVTRARRGRGGGPASANPNAIANARRRRRARGE